MYGGRLIWRWMAASLQKELAYRVNFWIHLLHSILNLGVGIAGLKVLFYHISALQGWRYSEALALLGVYLILDALRGLFIGPGMEALAGLGQEIWTGNFDFVLLRPVDVQFHVTFRNWQIFHLFDLVLGAGVLILAAQPGEWIRWLLCGMTLAVAVVLMYSVLLALAAFTFWNPEFLFTWVFDGLFQLARYPVDIYPPWLRYALTWIIPVGMMTSIPAKALTGKATVPGVLAGMLAAGVLLAGASWLFRQGLRRYASASS